MSVRERVSMYRLLNKIVLKIFSSLHVHTFMYIMYCYAYHYDYELPSSIVDQLRSNDYDKL